MHSIIIINLKYIYKIIKIEMYITHILIIIALYYNIIELNIRKSKVITVIILQSHTQFLIYRFIEIYFYVYDITVANLI